MQKRPYVIINCAASADGKIALPNRRQTRISSEEDLARVHRLRNECDAVLVGVNTVLNEDPKLTVKEKYLAAGTPLRRPLRVVLDSKRRTPKDALVVNGDAPTLIATDGGFENVYGKNVEVVDCGAVDDNNNCGNSGSSGKGGNNINGGDNSKSGYGKVDLEKLLLLLAMRGVKKIMVEGGETVIWSFLSSRLADELRVYVGPLVIGGTTSPTIAGGGGARTLDETIKLKLTSHEADSGGGMLLHWKIVG